METGAATGLATVDELNPVPGLQLYEAAPLAVNVVLPPVHILVVPETETLGVVFTNTVTCAVSEQLPDVPVTVYVVVTNGDAVGLAAEALLNPVIGNQLYEAAPLALNGVDVPEQMVVPPVKATTGTG